MNSSLFHTLVVALMLVPTLALAQVTLPMNGHECFLRVDPFDTAGPPLVVRLADYNIAPGGTLRIDPQGDFHNGPNGDLFRDMFAVFSTSDTLLAQNLLARVPGAIGTTLTTNTGYTCPNNAPTDIPQDFHVPPAGLDVTIPAGATHLFLQPVDCYVVDNSDPDGDFGVRLTFATAGVTDPRGSGLALSPPWPNPARARITLPFSLLAPGRARLAMYGVDGREVRVLLDGEATAGPHELAWDSRDGRGAPVPAGIYFARLVTERGAVERRVTVMR